MNQGRTSGQLVSDKEIIERLRNDLHAAEKELSDATRMIALLVLEAGGKVAISRRAILEISDDASIETTQDVINGGWVIRVRAALKGGDA